VRLGLDMDGTIADGRFLPPPRTRDVYMGLAPYDNNTVDILTDIIHEHEVFIITARSEDRADRMIRDWFDIYNIPQPTGIITNPHIGSHNTENAIWKHRVLVALGAKVMFDDSHTVWARQYAGGVETLLVDNPYWEDNQKVVSEIRLKSWKEISERIHHIKSR